MYEIPRQIPTDEVRWLVHESCREHFAKVMEQAAKDGLLYLPSNSGLMQTLQRIVETWCVPVRDDSGAIREYRRLVLYTDWAPRSFSFVVYSSKNGEQWEYNFNGGLIYQGPESPADGSFPALTVSLAEGVGWFMHT